MTCNNSRFNVTECLRTRQAKEVVKAIFQNLICANGTNISKIYCDLDTCFKNEIMDIMTHTLGIKVQFCSVDAHQANHSGCFQASITLYCQIWQHLVLFP